MRDRAREPAVVHRDREARHPRHEAVVVRGPSVGCRARVRVRPLPADVADVPDHRARELARAPLHLVVLRVVEDLAVVDRVPAVLLHLAAPDRVLRDHRDAADGAVHEPLGLGRPLARDQVVAHQHLGVLADVHERGEHLRMPRVVDVVEVDDRQVVVGVRPREPTRAAVVGPGRPHWVLLEGVEVADRGAHADVVHVVERLLDGRGVLVRVVVEEAEVEDVLERPDAPVERGVRRRRVVVRDRHRQVLLVDQAVGVGREQLRGAAPQGVLRDVVVVAQERDVVAVAPAHDDRPHRLARLHAVRGLVLDLLGVWVDVAVALVARRRVLTRRVAHAVGAVDHRCASPDLPVCVRGGGGQQAHGHRNT